MDNRTQALELIRSRMPIHELVGRYVALRSAGKGRWKGLCPFHQEKTPSFTVDDTKELFYCFGCKAGGDLFAFLQKVENLEFREVVERLAQETGVELPESSPGQREVKRELYQVLNLAQEYFAQGLTGEPLEYLRRRGLNAESIASFGLGYAPQGWDGLIKYLVGKNVSPQEGVDAGVLIEKEGRFFDRFRGRITFPISDPMGRIVAFTARSLAAEDQPKYLNSPETPIFKKSLLLYALPQARTSLHERHRAIVVEGLFDAIALHQMGFSEAVAVLGSSLSSEQAHLLKRHQVNELYLSFDADEAGRKATLQSLDLEIARSFLVYAVALDGGKDPGDLLLAPDGRERYEGFIGASLPEVEYRFQAASAGLDLNLSANKKKVLDALKTRLTAADPFDPVVDSLKAVVISRLGLDTRTLEDYLRSLKPTNRGRHSSVNPATSVGVAKSDLTEKRLIRELEVIAHVLAAEEHEFLSWAQYVEDHTWPPEGSLLAEFMQAAKEERLKNRVIKRFEARGEGAKLIERLVMAPSIEPKELEASLNDSMAILREVYLSERLERLKVELKTNPTVELLREIQEIQRAIEAERRVYRRVG
jgi:DNA primase